MELHTINQNEAGIRLGMADYYNGYKMSIPNTSMKIAGESIEDLHISDRIPHILRGTYLTVSNADVTRPCEIIGLQGGSATGTNEIKVDILPIQIADTTRDGLSITRDDRDITINGKCEPTGTIKTGTTVTHSNATDWARLNSFTNSNVSSTVEGTSFTLTDASSTKQASITELKGNTTQEGTPTPSSPVEVKTVSGDNNIVVSNKNLLNTVNFSGTKNGCPIALSSDNTFSSNGTTTGTQVLLGIDLISGAVANYGIYVNANATKIKLQAGSYTLSITNVQGTLENVGENFFVVAKYREGQSTGVAIKQTNFASMPMTFTLTEETEVFIAYQVQYTKANNYSFSFMLEKGNQPTTYLAHQGNSYRVDLGGKNLFDKTTIVAGDIRGLNTSTRLSSRQNIWLNAGTYTMTSNQTNTFRYAVGIENVGVPPLNSYPTYILDSGWKTGATTYTFTISQGGYLVLSLSKSSGNITVEEVADFEYQLEKRKCSNTIQSIYCNPYRTKQNR